MIRFMADGKTVEVPEGTNLLQALRSSGLQVPSLCNHSGEKHKSYCYVCAVEKKGGSVAASCAVAAEADMEIITDSEALKDLRRSSLDLILASHRGDCHAPCERVCPFGADIPRLLRFIAGKNVIKTVCPDDLLPFGELTCRLCHAPCEKACRRGKLDTPVAIRSQMVAAKAGSSGAGILMITGEAINADLVSGFALAWMKLKTEGKAGTVHFDEKTSEKVYSGWNQEVPWKELYDKIFVQAKRSGIELKQTSGVSAASIVPTRSLAASLAEFASVKGLSLKPKSPSVLPAALSEDDWATLRAEADDSSEAARCLHCDCRAKTDCGLLERSVEAGAASLRQPFVGKIAKKAFLPAGVAVDSGKCILCGACCDISQSSGVAGGFYLEGKGDQCALAWNGWEEHDAEILRRCVRACPTGALADI